MTGVIYSWLLSLGSVLTVLFLLWIVFGRKGYNAENKEPYSILVYFPQEMLEGKDPMRRSARILLYTYCGIDALASIFPMFLGMLPSGLVPFAVLFIVATILKDAALVSIALAPAYQFKPHLVGFVSFGGFAALSMVLSGVIFGNHVAVNQGLSLTLLVLAAVVGLSEIALMVNPRLAHWTKLNATVDEEGNVDTSRPKPFVLAFTEWLLIFLAAAGSLLSLTGYALLALASL